MNSDLNVTLPEFSISAQTPSLLEGQAQDNVIIGTLSDAAGNYSVSGHFDATFSFGSQSYPVTLVPEKIKRARKNKTCQPPFS